MNKQELIDILENLECSTESLSYDNGYEQGVYDSLSHVILLDEPKKVVVPKFVAKKIESYGSALEMLANEYFDQSFEEVDSDELACWIDGNVDLFFKAWVNGYEVEKEQLYYVFDTTTKQYLGVDKVLNKTFWLSSQNSGARTPLTEQEIKVIDERYWPFAMKVDGE
ncbi:hypothetical protein M222_0722 [Enterococcus faecalis AZ19]|uniref:DUF1642 domain-containing protein n=1 Tax=Enterococcus faecalis TaxID=1351 RepID=UPI00045B33DB|nr:DUF1642 domain-containing protein [Enterococcus faecalis]KAJ76019.1 hypothetical protein M222_0722 [Enterococcus faecalis AZ19]